MDENDEDMAAIIAHLTKALELARKLGDDLTAGVIAQAIDEALMSPIKNQRFEKETNPLDQPDEGIPIDRPHKTDSSDS